MSNPTSSYTLIYDGDCAFCSRCVDWGERNLKQWPNCKASQVVDPEQYGLTRKQFSESIWLVSDSIPNFKPLPANRAAAKILQDQSNPFWKAAGIVADIIWLRPIARLIYDLVASNRDKMPGATDECKLPPK